MKTLLSIATLFLLVSVPAWAQQKTRKGLLGSIEITAPAQKVRSALIDHMLSSTDYQLQHETSSMLVFRWQGVIRGIVVLRFILQEKEDVTKIQVTGERITNAGPLGRTRMKGKRAKKDMKKLLEGLKQKLEAQPSTEPESVAGSEED